MWMSVDVCPGGGRARPSDYTQTHTHTRVQRHKGAHIIHTYTHTLYLCALKPSPKRRTIMPGKHRASEAKTEALHIFPQQRKVDERRGAERMERGRGRGLIIGKDDFICQSACRSSMQTHSESEAAGCANIPAVSHLAHQEY